jgi:glycosyltransferase involved in cell wall biosynthesis
MNISVIMIVKNGTKHLTDDWLATLCSHFHEILILVDSSTTDQTLQLLGGHSKIKFEMFDFKGFGYAKKLAEKKAANDWILSLDADEILDSTCLNTLKTLSPASEKLIYSFKRLNFYNYRHINGAGWNDDMIIRLYNKKHTGFEDKHIHEFVKKQHDSVLVPMAGHIKHYPYSNVSELVLKMNYYSDLFVIENKHKTSSSFAKSVFKGGFTFFRDYFLDRGFLFGYEGFVIAYTNAAGTFYKYIKLFEAQKRLKNTKTNDTF